ncbi:MAG TPA: permease prefix domain 1-containing protein [Clostridia bacterium]|nr:permease prefix domain 1-containing protein [Clostridia bacterium]
MITIKEYVDRMFRNIPENEQTIGIKQEIIENLQEKVMDLMESGKAEEDAINKAIVDFGDFDEILSELSSQSSVETKVKRLATAEEKYRKTTNAFLFSLCGSAIIIALMVFINMYYSPQTIWFVYPVFAVIWWPLALFFSWIGRRAGRQK